MCLACGLFIVILGGRCSFVVVVLLLFVFVCFCCFVCVCFCVVLFPVVDFVSLFLLFAFGVYVLFVFCLVPYFPMFWFVLFLLVLFVVVVFLGGVFFFCFVVALFLFVFVMFGCWVAFLFPCSCLFRCFVFCFYPAREALPGAMASERCLLNLGSIGSATPRSPSKTKCGVRNSMHRLLLTVTHDSLQNHCKTNGKMACCFAATNFTENVSPPKQLEWFVEVNSKTGLKDAMGVN